eukprot:scaffold19818_cov63-Phaeocystis_antarctica.AAC.6
MVIKQSKRGQKSKDQMPLQSHSSHPTGFQNQNNQNPGTVRGNINITARGSAPLKTRADVSRAKYPRGVTRNGRYIQIPLGGVGMHGYSTISPRIL